MITSRQSSVESRPGPPAASRIPAIAIIGAGFSGSLLAVHLLRRGQGRVRVLLVEGHGQFGRGLAYGSGNFSHLLNVPAGRMSAFSDDPGHFLAWLRALAPAERGIDPVDGASFVPRRLYGAYIQSLLGRSLRDEAGIGGLTLIADEAVGLTCGSTGLCVTAKVGRRYDVDIAVLATGNLPPEPPPVADPAFYETPLYRPDPWRPDTFDGLRADDPVLLIGTGLTMVDTVVSLLDRGHAGPIIALSRRGLVPHAHAPSRHPAGAFLPDPVPLSITTLLRLVRAQARDDWRGAIDSLRPLTRPLWRALPDPERRRFLRHLRPWWDIHRHRMAPEVADRIGSVRASGQLSIRGGRIAGYAVAGDRVTIRYRPRAGGPEQAVVAARVINCSGPNCDYTRIRDPLLRGLFQAGAIRPDSLRLGLDVTAEDAIIGQDGGSSGRLYAMGPVTRGAWWEITAVPDIRGQAEALADRLMARLGLR